MAQRIPIGLDRLPRSLSPDDPRLPGVSVAAQPLRLNTEPLPVEAMPPAAGGHAARLAALRSFLHGLCGHAPQRRRFIDAYLEGVAAHLVAHRAELTADLQRYHGLYAPEDWLWSALRPLPRAWLRTGAGMVFADVAFWDGAQPIAIDFGGGQRPSGVVVCCITAAALAGDPLALLMALPESLHCFWRGVLLPRSPFRRAIPRGVLDPAV